MSKTTSTESANEERRNNALKGCNELQSAAAVLIDTLFPKTADENSCLRLRRICHPSYSDRYFTLAYLHGDCQEAAIELFANKVNQASDDGRSTLITDYLTSSDPDAVVLHYEMLRLFVKDFNPGVLQSIIVSVFRASELCQIPDIQQKRRVLAAAEQLIAALVSRLGDDNRATEILSTIIRSSHDLHFASDLNRRVKLAEKGYDDTSFGGIHPNIKACQAALDELIEQQFLDDDVDLFALPRDTWILALSEYSKSEQMKTSVVRRLQRNPALCARLLELVCRVHQFTDGTFQFVQPDLESAEAFPFLSEIFTIIHDNRDSLDLSPSDTALIDGFAAWYQSVFTPHADLSSSP